MTFIPSIKLFTPSLPFHFIIANKKALIEHINPSFKIKGAYVNKFGYLNL